MKKSKFGKYMLCGAVVGAIVSLFDRSTRERMQERTKNTLSAITFYTKNPDILKLKTTEKVEKFQSIYEQLSGDAVYIKEKVEEIKLLSPQVKELVTDTKEAFTDAKEEYQTIVSEESGERELGK